MIAVSLDARIANVCVLHHDFNTRVFGHCVIFSGKKVTASLTPPPLPSPKSEGARTPVLVYPVRTPVRHVRWPQLSRQNTFHHGKIKFKTTNSYYSRQTTNTHGKISSRSRESQEWWSAVVQVRGVTLHDQQDVDFSLLFFPVYCLQCRYLKSRFTPVVDLAST